MASSDRLAQILRARADFGVEYGLSDDRADAFNWLIGLLNGDEPKDLTGGSPLYRFAAPVRLTTFDGVDEDGAVYTDELTGRDAPSSLVRGQHGKHLEVEKSGGGFVTMMHDEGIYIGEDVPLIGDVEITGDLLADQDAEIVGNLVVGGTLGVTGATTLQSTLHVVGATTLDATLGVTGVTTLTAALLANGAVTLGDAAADAVTVKGTATFERLITATLGLTATTGNIAATAGALTQGALPATTGAVRLTNATGIKGRNAGNDADIDLIYTDAFDDVFVGALTGMQFTYLLGTTGTGLRVGANVEVEASTTYLKLGRTGGSLSLFGATPVTQPAAGAAADGTLASATTLVNSLRTGLRALGAFS